MAQFDLRGGLFRAIAGTKLVSVAPSRQWGDAHSSPKPYFFSLSLSPESPASGSECALATGKLIVLKPGMSYVVCAASSLDQDEETSLRPITAVRDLEIYLTASCSAIQIEDLLRRVSVEEFPNVVLEFRLAVASECPLSDAQIQLLARSVVNPHEKPRPLASLHVELQGTYAATDELQTITSIKLDSSLPEGTAIVHVEQGTNALRLTAWHYRNRPLTIDPFPRPPLSLAAFREEKVAPLDIRDTVRYYSRRSPQQLIQWIKLLLNRFGQGSSVVITDHTGSDFPWEMFEIPTDAGQEMPLGALVSISRWIPVQYYDLWRRLEITDDLCIGDAIAFLDEAIANSASERQALGLLRTEYCDTLERLRVTLSASVSSRGLIYLGCHGAFVHKEHAGNFEQELLSGAIDNPSARVVAIDFELGNIAAGHLPIAFVNACHSGRLVLDNLKRLSGLPEVFLARLARGYLGTLGPVGSDYADRLADSLLKSAAGPDGVQIGEFLRKQRLLASTHFSNDPTNKKLGESYVYTFMYVYYGNPLLRLKLIPFDDLDTEAVQP